MLRNTITFLIFVSALALSAPLQAAVKKTPDLVYANPERAESLVFDGYLMITIFYSGQCPGCARWMAQDVKAIHDLIEAEKLPAVLVLVTPDKTANQLAGYSESVGFEGAILAQDKANALNISLNNIHQYWIAYDGKKYNEVDNFKRLRDAQALIDKTGAHYRFPVDGLENDKAKELWCLVERKQPGAVEYLVKAAKKSPVKEEAQKILDVVSKHYTELYDKLMAAEDNFDTYEGIETLLSEAGAIGFDDGKKRLRTLGKDAGIKDELKARKAYNSCMELLAAATIRKREQGAAGFKQIADRYPETKYGKLADKKRDMKVK